MKKHFFYIMGNQAAKPKDSSKKNDLTSIDLEEHIPIETKKVQATLISLPSKFKDIESLDDPTLYEYLEHHPNINRMYVLTFVFLILYLLIINQRSFKL